MNSSNNLDGSYAIGNGEVDSSILSGSTIQRADYLTFFVFDFHRLLAQLEWNHRVTTRVYYFAACGGLASSRTWLLMASELCMGVLLMIFSIKPGRIQVKVHDPI